MNHVPGTGSIAPPDDQQSRALPLYHRRPHIKEKKITGDNSKRVSFIYIGNLCRILTKNNYYQNRPVVRGSTQREQPSHTVWCCVPVEPVAMTSLRTVPLPPCQPRSPYRTHARSPPPAAPPRSVAVTTETHLYILSAQRQKGLTTSNLHIQLEKKKDAASKQTNLDQYWHFLPSWIVGFWLVRM